jgi:hypothetical protein
LNPRSSLKGAPPAATLLAPLLAALALAGCGGGSSAPAPTAQGAPAASPPSAKGSTASEPSGPSAPAGEGGGSGSGRGEEAHAPHETPEASIEGYGSAAQGAEKAQIARDAFAFFKAMAARRYAAVCAGLSAANREELRAFLKAERKASGGCAAALPSLLARAGPEAKRAAQGSLTAVRVKGPTAFVIFRPKGGAPSYFVLKREGSAWKAISLAPGAPLNPTAGAP